MPEVSVIVSSYNGEEYIREQLDSIFNQTYPLSEVIIADDCSTDHSWNIICEYRKKYPILKAFRHARNIGMNNNFIFLVEHATHELIVCSDQDDIWVPNKVEKQISAIGDSMLCFSFSKPFRMDGIDVPFNAKEPNFRLMRLVYQNAIPGHTMLIRKKLFYLIPQKYIQVFAPDQLLALTAAAYESISFVPEILVHYRHHLSSVSYTKPASYEKTFINMFVVLFRTFKNWIELKEEMKEYFIKEYDLLALMDSDKDDKKIVQRMLSAYIKGGIKGYFELTILNLKYRDYIFHCKESNYLLSILRSLYFPISSSDYFRYLSKKYHRQ